MRRLSRKSTLADAALLAVLGALLVAGRASAGGPAPSSATLLIRHQVAHCHAWSLDGDAFAAHQQTTLRPGATLRVVDDDVMPHRLVQLAGPRVTMRNGTTIPMMSRYGSRTPGAMSHMGASTTVTFPQAGVYRFRTRAGEDYLAGVQTTGEDNVLTLTVVVR